MFRVCPAAWLARVTIANGLDANPGWRVFAATIGKFLRQQIIAADPSIERTGSTTHVITGVVFSHDDGCSLMHDERTIAHSIRFPDSHKFDQVLFGTVKQVLERLLVKLMPDKKSPHRRPLALLEPTVTLGLASRLRFARLQARFPGRSIWALFMFINGFVTIAILAGVAMVSHTPFVFPSLGPTAILLFYTPLSPTASPRHTIYGHAIGIVCGYGSLLLTHLHHTAPATIVGVDSSRILAAALSLAATSAFMILLKAAHPPAGATTLIISLGIVTRPSYLLVIEIAVVLLVLQAIVINRLGGLDYPLWAKRVDTASEPSHVPDPED